MSNKTRVYFRQEDTDWFYQRYPGEALSVLMLNLIQEFRFFTADRDGTLQEHIQQFHEQVN